LLVEVDHDRSLRWFGARRQPCLNQTFGPNCRP
jgi:hypothetical protein